jgi:hypothetical protein
VLVFVNLFVSNIKQKDINIGDIDEGWGSFSAACAGFLRNGSQRRQRW